MKRLKYPLIEDWLTACAKLVQNDWDNITLWTGEEGTGKSTIMRQVARAQDPDFNVDRIHFDQDDYMADASSLPRGRAAVLDEWRGHKRASMHGHRLDFLDFLKECRGLNLHQHIGFPHVTQADSDILRSRVRHWCHLEERGRFKVRERFAQVRIFRGEPEVMVKWVLVGHYKFRPGDSMETAYRAKKEARMRERAAQREASGVVDLGLDLDALRGAARDLATELVQHD